MGMADAKLKKDERLCPFCAEVVKAAALVCKHCSKELPAAPVNPKPKTNWFILGVLAFIAIAVGLVKLTSPSNEPSATVSSVSHDQLSAQTSPASLTPENHTDALPSSEPSLTMGQTFDLGELEYVVSGTKRAQRLGNAYTGSKADDGSVFLRVDFKVKNLSKETKTVASDSFSIIAPDGTEFKPDSNGLTALMMDGGKADFLLSQLQPGITKKSVTVFEIPSQLRTADLQLKIPSDNAFSGEQAVVSLR